MPKDKYCHVIKLYISSNINFCLSRLVNMIPILFVVWKISGVAIGSEWQALVAYVNLAIERLKLSDVDKGAI